MKKYLGFLVCIAISLGLFWLSLITEDIKCDRASGNCTLTSKVNYFNIELNREVFPITSLQKAYCEKRSQPSRKGKQTYYMLIVDINERPYNISSFKKHAQCKAQAQEIRGFIKNKTRNEFELNSPTGFLNAFGIMFGIIAFIVGIIMLK